MHQMYKCTGQSLFLFVKLQLDLYLRLYQRLSLSLSSFERCSQTTIYACIKDPASPSPPFEGCCQTFIYACINELASPYLS